MQNHPIYKTTPEQGWSLMVPVLDKAMPVARKSRRILAYWWTAAAVILAIVVTRIATLETAGPAHQQNISQRTAQNNAAPGTETGTVQQPDNASVAGTHFDNTSSKSDELENSNTSSTKSKNIIPATENHTTNSTASHGEPYKLNHSIVKSTKPVFKIDERLTEVEPVGISADPNSIQTPEGKETVEDAVAIAIESEALQSHDKGVHAIIDVASLSSLEIDALPVESFVMDDIQPGRIRRAISKKKLFTPHVDASVLETYTSGTAAYAGGGVDINILPRLSITTGAGCSIYNPELTLFSENETRTADYESLLKSDLGYQGIPEYLPADAFSNATPAALNQYISSIRQWHLSAGLKYDLSRKFYVEGGVTFNMLSSVYSKYPIVSVLLVNDPLSGGNLDVTNSFENFNLVHSQTNSFYAGLGYRPGKKTEVFAQWVHGADSYLKGSAVQGVSESDNNDYIRGLSLGFRYNL